MNTVDLLQFSLKNAFDILAAVTSDLTQEQADWVPEGTCNGIGSQYWHVISGTDMAVHAWGMGQPALFESGDWQAKVLLATPEPEGDHPAQIREVRIDLTAMHAYTQAVADAAQDWLASLTPEDLERAIKTPVGELNLGQMLSTFVVWHVSSHCGEISALKGCQGGRGYPF